MSNSLSKPSPSLQMSAHADLASKFRILLLLALGLVRQDTQAPPLTDPNPTYEEWREEVHKKLNVTAVVPVCEAYKQTALTDSRFMTELCLSGNPKEQAGYDSSCEGMALMRASLVMTEEKGTPLAGIPKDLASLEDFPDGYREIFQDYAPDFFSHLGPFVYYTPSSLSIGTHAGQAVGPGEFVGEKYRETEKGQFYLINTKHPLDKIDVEELMASGDKKRLAVFLENASVLSHEIYGHVEDSVSDPDKHYETIGKGLCGNRGLPRFLSSELYAYYQGARMIDYLVDHYPAMEELMNEEIAIHQSIRARYQANSNANRSVDAELRDLEMKGALLLPAMRTTLYEAYKTSESSHDWLYFRDFVIAGVFNEGFGLPYLLSYFKDSDLSQDCYQNLNKRIKGLLVNESPEKLRGIYTP